MTLHKKYSSVIYNANDLAYLSQMYLIQGQYEKAEKLMKKAFSMLIEQEKLLEKSFLEYQGWYLFLISQIQQKTGRIKEGIKNLNRAKIFLESSD
jgi:tetratricopeptide (TPR) repeat protein